MMDAMAKLESKLMLRIVQMEKYFQVSILGLAWLML